MKTINRRLGWLCAQGPVPFHFDLSCFIVSYPSLSSLSSLFSACSLHPAWLLASSLFLIPWTVCFIWCIFFSSMCPILIYYIAWTDTSWYDTYKLLIYCKTNRTCRKCVSWMSVKYWSLDRSILTSSTIYMCWKLHAYVSRLKEINETSLLNFRDVIAFYKMYPLIFAFHILWVSFCFFFWMKLV